MKLAAITTLNYEMNEFEIARVLGTYAGVVEKYLKIKELVKKDKNLLKKDKISDF